MMFNNADRKILLGLVTGALLSTSVASVWAATQEEDTRHLIDSTGKPVLTSQDKKCVQTPNTPNEPMKKFEECGDVSDRDGDGVPDDQDKCPDNTKEEISKGVYGDKNNPNGPADKIGCPIDTDGDSVEDYRDDCPNTPPDERRCVDERGCTKDSDRDGINDCKDRCPTVAGVAENDGCPKSGTRAAPISLSSDTAFDFGKFTLRPDARASLDQIISDINRHSANRNFDEVFVEGYTDPVGTDASNMKLSINRSKAVADYLIMNGIPANKIVQKGYGESQCTLPEKVKGESKKARNERLQSCRRVDISLSLFQPEQK